MSRIEEFVKLVTDEISEIKKTSFDYDHAAFSYQDEYGKTVKINLTSFGTISVYRED